MITEKKILQLLIEEMHEEYRKGENVMEIARNSPLLNNTNNHVTATLIAYDLQSGSYIELAKKEPDFYNRWCQQIASLLSPFIDSKSSVIEVGCGEATTLGGMLLYLKKDPLQKLGFDISWSRINYGQKYLTEINKSAKLFVADLFTIPLASNSIDVVYTSHSIEPNGGREKDAIMELLRVSRRWVVIVEPIYELASEEGRKRMEKHGYVRDLKKVAERCGVKIIDYRLLEHIGNNLNPSGVIILEKVQKSQSGLNNTIEWRCPITGAILNDHGDAFLCNDMGIVYPVLRGIPLLRPEHAVVASSFS